MHAHPKRRRSIARLAAGAALATATVCVAEPMPGAALDIAIFPDHYVLAGGSTDDLDVLERAVAALRPRSIRLYACGDDTERLQRAAAHRFRHLDLHLRRLEPSSPDCRAAVVMRPVHAGRRAGRHPFGIDDAAVDRWWHASMP